MFGGSLLEYERGVRWLCLENRLRELTERSEPLGMPSWGSSYLIVTMSKGFASPGPNCHPSNGTRKDNEVPITGGSKGAKWVCGREQVLQAPTLSASSVALGQALHGEVPGCICGAEPHQDTVRA